MKKILARVGILGAIFVAAVVIFSILTSRQNADMTVDMGNASLPQIIFETEGYELNPLAGYTSEMDLTAMRDTLTPLDKDGNLTVRIKKNQKKIKDFSYTVYSLNVQKTLAERGKAVIKDEAAILSLGAAIERGEEKSVLKIELLAGGWTGDPLLYADHTCKGVSYSGMPGFYRTVSHRCDYKESE